MQGTNLQHALLLAGRHLRRHPEAEPVVMVVTDGEPTAHLEPDGTPYFNWPTTRETLRATVAEIDQMTRYGATLNLFMLGDDPGLARFVDAIARRNGGRVFTPELGRLGEYVVADYLRAAAGRTAASRRGRTAGPRGPALSTLRSTRQMLCQVPRASRPPSPARWRTAAPAPASRGSGRGRAAVPVPPPVVGGQQVGAARRAGRRRCRRRSR